MEAPRRHITVVSFLGRPFAGKDFQADRFEKKYPGVVYFSTGALLRDQELLAQTFHPDQVAEVNRVRDAGGNVRPEIVEQLAHEKILELARQGHRVIILAGHPRTAHQLRDMIDWSKKQTELGEFDIERVSVLMGIRKGRANLRRTKRLETEDRPDDRDEQAVAQRHWEYRTNLIPLIPQMFLRGLFNRRERFAYVRSDQDPDKVTRRLEHILQPYLQQA